MKWSFRTSGNYIEFVHTEETSLMDEEVVFRLHNTSRCISWSLPVDTTRMSFTIDEVRYENILIADIDFDGSVMNEQADFETGITEMFPGLAGGSSEGGSSSYLVYVAFLTQNGGNPAVPTILENTLGGEPVWSMDGTGENTIYLADAFPHNKVAVFITTPGFVEFVHPLGDDEIKIVTYDETYSAANNWLNNVSIEIRVYP